MAILVRLKKTITDAILTVLKYVKNETGEEPTQEEIEIELLQRKEALKGGV